MLSDGRTAALLARDGSIDWLCWPRFDDDACFAALLGCERNGHWSIAPASAVVGNDRRYQDDTLVMETDFETADGVVRIIDFLPVGTPSASIVRMVIGLSGKVAVRSTMRLRFDYGAVSPWVALEDDTVIAKIGPDMVVLRASVPLEVESGDELIEANFVVTQGDRVAFSMRYGRSYQPVPDALDPDAELIATQQFWRNWLGRFDNRKTLWPAQVRRSLLTLKAMIYLPTGGLVASPTTSLPEAHGGTMNWDYRYCWLRDASFAMVTLLNAGFHDEVKTWRDWLLRAIAGEPERIGVLYRVDGSRHVEERTIDWLEGYGGSKPVRVGNKASTQTQIDVLGEVVDCLNLARRSGRAASEQEVAVEMRIVMHLEQVWDKPGSGIWESRSEPRHYVYARVMAWVAVDRFVAHHHDDAAIEPSLLARLKQLAGTIREDIYRNGWNESLGSFTHCYGGDEVDASLLLLPLVGFLPADDPRMRATIERIQCDLAEGGLIRRMRRKAKGRNEATFLACSCWMADCLSLLGHNDEARTLFERVLGVANDLGLFSEQYDVKRKCLAGNFPQALTHLAVVNTALGLCGPVLQRGGG